MVEPPTHPKNMLVKLDTSPKLGMKISHISNHHPGEAGFTFRPRHWMPTVMDPWHGCVPKTCNLKLTCNHDTASPCLKDAMVQHRKRKKSRMAQWALSTSRLFCGLQCPKTYSNPCKFAKTKSRNSETKR